MKYLVLLTLLSVLGGCVTTGENDEKWEKQERVDLHTRIGANYYEKGQFEVALDSFEKALKIDPSHSQANMAMAHLQTRLGDYPKARYHFARAVRADRDNYVARNDYGLFLCETGQIEDGLEQLQAALENPLNDARPLSYFRAGECKRIAGNADEAIRYYESALGLRPDLRPALYQMARISFDQSQHLKTRAFLERFFQNNTYTDDALFLAVQNELLLERREIASDYAKQLRARFPRSELIAKLRPLFNGS